MLRVGKLTERRAAAADQDQEPVRRRPDGHRHPSADVGDHVDIELSSQRIPATVVWIRGDLVGLKFDHNVDLGELLAGRKQRHGFRPRPPRLEMNCKASVRVGKIYYTVDVHDISLGE